MDNVGIDAGHRLYWDGEQIVTQQVQRLAWFERAFGALAVLAAVCGVFIQAWSWGCELQWLDSNHCPPMISQAERP
ncbi:hypothetical protein [Ruegeria meonggei]|uniref:Uncharacterized protein n=1 Tax=Ruegeria meonggei TaxID=1446476 RepID=A0A1X6Z1T4_9RHOB|nr:hypothetical protein [Ruegeria meonggei]SLN37680.1 hypothetical protein RUM8411_01640 [Ruegeria meonggei]